MSNRLAIATVTAMLGQILLPALREEVNGADVSHRRPDDPQGNAAAIPRVNIFLYQITPNAAFRNADLPTRSSESQVLRPPQVALNLHYLLTFYGNEAELEPQRMLGAAASRLHSRAVITREAIEAYQAVLVSQPNDPLNFLVASDLAQQIELVKLAPVSLNLEELSKLWSVFVQTPYTLSAVYQASVVLIDATEASRPGLPVQRRGVYVLPFRQPVIERVEPDTGRDRPITAADTLVIEGQNLRGEITRISLGGQLLAPSQLTSQRAELPLPGVPAGALRSGVQGVQIVHRLLMGEPPIPHDGVSSNVAAFVLRPSLVVDNATAAQVTVTITPPVGQAQRVVLLLNRLDPGDPRAYRFPGPERNADASQIVVPIQAVQPGNYVARVQIDGAESLLAVDNDPTSPTYRQFTGPLVVIP